MRRRRLVLLWGVVAAVVVNGFWLLHAQGPTDLRMTQVGLDSLAIVVPERRPVARLIDGAWDADPQRYGGQPIGGVPRLAYVSLAPDPTFGSAIRVMHDLRRRGMCNVVIREGGRPSGVLDFPDGRDRALELPALVLCGEPIGGG